MEVVLIVQCVINLMTNLKNVDWECGFVDKKNEFLQRDEAWKIANAAGQIRRPLGFEKDYSNQRNPNIGDSELLFSENLY